MSPNFTRTMIARYTTGLCWYRGRPTSIPSILKVPFWPTESLSVFISSPRFTAVRLQYVGHGYKRGFTLWRFFVAVNNGKALYCCDHRRLRFPRTSRRKKPQIRWLRPVTPRLHILFSHSRWWSLDMATTSAAAIALSDRNAVGEQRPDRQESMNEPAKSTGTSSTRPEKHPYVYISTCRLTHYRHWLGCWHAFCQTFVVSFSKKDWHEHLSNRV